MTIRLSDQDFKDARTLWNYHVMPASEPAADLVIALGSHDLRVAEHAAQLMLAGVAPILVLTGGAGKVTSQTWVESEADVYASVVLGRGVRADSVVYERASKNTTDNFVNSKTILADMGTEVSTGIIVCKPYMCRRAMAVATKQWPEVAWVVSPPRIAIEDDPSEGAWLYRIVRPTLGDVH